MRWRRRSKATRRCGRSTSAVCGPLARVHLRGRGPLRGDLASARAERRERLVVVVGAACVSAGSEHGVVRGAGSDIEAEGAVALAAALKGNTTLRTLDLGGMWTARTRAFCGNGRPLPGTLRQRRRGSLSGWWLWSARRARVRAVSMAWCVVQSTASKPRAPSRLRGRSKATRRCGRSTSTVCGPLARVHSAGMGAAPRGTSRVRERGEARVVGGCGCCGVRKCGQ